MLPPQLAPRGPVPGSIASRQAGGAGWVTLGKRLETLKGCTVREGTNSPSPTPAVQKGHDTVFRVAASRY